MGMNMYGTEAFIKAVYGGNEHMLAIWHHPASGVFKPLHEVLIGARHSVESFHISATSIAEDPDLSSAGKNKARGEKAVFWLRAIGRHQRQLNEIKSEIEERKNTLAKVPEPGANDTAVDLAIAHRLASMSDKEMSSVRSVLLFGSDDRLVQAVLRMPTFLTGLSEEFKSKVAIEEVKRKAPQESSEVEELSEAANTTQAGLRAAFSAVLKATGGSLSYTEQMEILGDSAWQHLMSGPEDVLQGIHNRMEQEAAEAAEDAEEAEEA